MAEGFVKPSSPDGQILTVKELLSDKSLTIPLYQRPYKWTGKNVTQLFNDIATHKDKSSYRLGTIVYRMQENCFFHGYYDYDCFLPLYVFCGDQLLAAYLRPSKIDAAKHA